MKSFFLLSFLGLCMACAGSHAAGKPDYLSCDEREGGEKAALARAGKDVQRTAPHQLDIEAGGKKLVFKDEPPYDEMGGTLYEYCGQINGYHLLYKRGDPFTGVLIDMSSGNTIPGGISVLFSQDKRAFLATEQEDGMDGAVWKVYGVNGRLSWSGFSFIKSARKAGHFVATLDQVAWGKNGELSAMASCVADSKIAPGRVTLKKIKDQWDWYPRSKCADTP